MAATSIFKQFGRDLTGEGPLLFPVTVLCRNLDNRFFSSLCNSANGCKYRSNNNLNIPDITNQGSQLINSELLPQPAS
jgi:hypothetical protein